MGTPKNSTQVAKFFKRARVHYEWLGIKPDDDRAFLEHCGIGRCTKDSWYRTGIKPVYNRLLDFIDELKEVREARDAIEKEFNFLLGEEVDVDIKD